jgi:hypothetical protein
LLYQGEPENLKGNILNESAPGTSLGTFILELPLDCDKNYTITAYAAQPTADTVFSELRSFTTMKGGNWIPRSIFPGEVRDLSISFSIGKHFYMGGGKVPAPTFFERSHFLDFWSYDSETDAWSAISQIEEGVGSPIAGSANAMGYYGSGQWSSEKCLDFWGGDCLNGSRDCLDVCHCTSKDFFSFDPSTSTFQPIMVPDSIQDVISRHS